MPESSLFRSRLLSRRSFLTIVAAAGGMLVASGMRQTTPAAEAVRAERILMGTRVHLALVAPDAGAAREAVEETFQAMARLVSLFDHRRPTSALARLNRTGAIDGAPPEFGDLMRQAVWYGEQTGGAFDVTIKPLVDAALAGTVPNVSLQARVDYRQIEVNGERVRLRIPGAAVTLDGIAKGRIIDEGVATLRRLGFDQVLVEAGGDLRALGARSDGSPWRIGIAHPRHADAELLATLRVKGKALATSGDYMNRHSADYTQHHILSPHTGTSPLDLASATVLAPTALAADALATALMVLGSRDGLTLAKRLPDTEAVLVTKQMAVLHTSGATLL